MFRIILVTARPRELESFTRALAQGDKARVEVAGSGARALELAQGERTHLVVIDGEPGDMDDMELVRRLLELDATINTALVSGLAEEEFHERYEGLGILCRLEPVPGSRQARELLELLEGLVLPPLVEK